MAVPSGSVSSSSRSDRFPRWSVPVAAAAVLAVLLWVAGADRDRPDPTATTFDEAAIAVTTSTNPATTLPPAATETPPVSTFPARSRPVGAAVPGLDDHLVFVVGQGDSGHTLISTDTETTEWAEQSLPAHAAEFALDASGRILGFIERAPGAEPTLWLASRNGEPVAMTSANQFVWSGDEEGRIAWLDRDSPPGQVTIQVGSTDGSRLAGTSDLGVVPSNFRLLGLNSKGYWLGSYDPRVAMPFVTYFPSDRPAGIPHSGDLAVPAPRGTTALIAHLEVAGWLWNFGISDGIRMEPAGWAPSRPSGMHGFAAWSSDAGRLAFIGGDDDGSWLEIWSPSGDERRRIEFPHRVWDVSWSHDDRFVVMPGSGDDEDVVLFFDTHDGSLDAAAFDDRVQFAATAEVPGPGPLPEAEVSST